MILTEKEIATAVAGRHFAAKHLLQGIIVLLLLALQGLEQILQNHVLCLTGIALVLLDARLLLCLQVFDCRDFFLQPQGDLRQDERFRGQEDRQFPCDGLHRVREACVLGVQYQCILFQGFQHAQAPCGHPDRGTESRGDAV